MNWILKLNPNQVSVDTKLPPSIKTIDNAIN